VTTWDPANSPNATLTGGNLVATFNSSSFSNGALSNTSKSSGKFVFDVGIVCSNPSDNAIGITQGAPPGAYYDSPTSWLFVPQSGYSMVRNNGGSVATEFTAPPPTSPYTLRVYVDLTALKVYFSIGGVYYFGGDASAGTGGLTIPSGAFYINGFSTAGGDALTLNPSPTGLPAGWSAWDAPPRIDGKDHATGFSGTTRTLTLTTTQPNDYIIVSAVTNSTGIASVVGSSLGAFTLISSAARGGTSSLQVWAKFAASPLTSEVITVTQDDSNFMTCDAWAVAGTGQTSLVWSTGSPQKVDNASTSVSITTTEAKSVVIGAHAVNDNGVTPASGFTLIYGSDYALTQYKELSAAGTETISGGSSTLQASIAIAIPIAVVGGGATLTASGLTNTAPKLGPAYLTLNGFGIKWNPADQSNVTVTGSGLIATVNNTGSVNGIRATTSKSGSGKWVVDFTVNNQNGGFYGFEIGGKNPYYDNGLGIYQLHIYSGGVLFEEASGSWLFFDNTTLAGGYPAYGTPFTVRFFMDLDNGKFYVQINGTNMGGCNPTAQTGGFSFTPSGPLFPFFGGLYSGESATLNPTPTSLPAGWSPWEAPFAPLVLGDYPLDFGLNAFLLANKIVVCSQKPTTYTEANSTYKIGEKTFSGGVGTVWDVSTGNGAMISSGGGTIATSNGINSWCNAVGGGARTSGKRCFQITCDFGADKSFGIIQAGHTDPDGNDALCCNFYWGSSYYFLRQNGGWLTNEDTSADPTGIADVIRFFVDIDASKIYVTVNGNNVLNTNVAAGTGGVTFTNTNPWVPFCKAVFGGTAYTLDPNPTGLPSGWTAWDGATGGGVITAGPQDATPTGRQVVTAAVTGGTVTTNGTPTNWAIVDDTNSRLLAAGDMTGSVAVTTADSWTLDAMTINVP